MGVEKRPGDEAIAHIELATLTDGSLATWQQALELIPSLSAVLIRSVRVCESALQAGAVGASPDLQQIKLWCHFFGTAS